MHVIITQKSSSDRLLIATFRMTNDRQFVLNKQIVKVKSITKNRRRMLELFELPCDEKTTQNVLLLLDVTVKLF